MPRIGLHDLRHLAATLTFTAGVPLTVVSKTLRHSTLSTTANLYSHLTQQAARDAVDTIDQALTNADQDGTRRHWPNWLRPYRDHTERHRKRLKPLYSPAPAASSPPNFREGMRPPGDHQACEHGKGRSLISEKMAYDLRKRWSGRQDLNLRPLTPSASG
ncbi:tyrosine-type recombinase/integrase [Streptomyces sp. 8N616]|uniref:tyrosine-type recombinase/integrase n=1 Tax=Streptomyces sp. 8N616 TaxID=3457414 RepID=UPI003FCFE082